MQAFIVYLQGVSECKPHSGRFRVCSSDREAAHFALIWCANLIACDYFPQHRGQRKAAEAPRAGHGTQQSPCRSCKR